MGWFFLISPADFVSFCWYVQTMPIPAYFFTFHFLDIIHQYDDAMPLIVFNRSKYRVCNDVDHDCIPSFVQIHNVKSPLIRNKYGTERSIFFVFEPFVLRHDCFLKK